MLLRLIRMLKYAVPSTDYVVKGLAGVEDTHEVEKPRYRLE